MSKMITLTPIQKLLSVNSGISTFIDRTNYGQSENPGFTLDDFIGSSSPLSGVRILRLESPNGDVTLYSFARNIATNQSVTEFLPATDFESEVLLLNNENYKFSLDTPVTGTYKIWILSIPKSTQVSEDYDVGDISMFPQAPNRSIYRYDGEGQFSPLFTDVDFTGIPENYINKFSFENNSDVADNIECIFGKYESSFCTGCGCEDVCKNKKSNNILKATMMLRELELLESNTFEYDKKVELFTQIFKILCHCS